MTTPNCQATVHRTGRPCGRLAYYKHYKYNEPTCGYHYRNDKFVLSQPPPPPEEESHGDCSICMDTIKSSDLEITPCKHAFHKKCLIEWKKRSNSCPLCRRFLENNDYENNAIVEEWIKLGFTVRLVGRQFIGIRYINGHTPQVRILFTVDNRVTILN